MFSTESRRIAAAVGRVFSLSEALSPDCLPSSASEAAVDARMCLAVGIHCMEGMRRPRESGSSPRRIVTKKRVVYDPYTVKCRPHHLVRLVEQALIRMLAKFHVHGAIGY